MGQGLMVAGFIACLIVAAVLIIGIGGFGSGKMTPETQNKMMRYRIIGQAVAVVLILLAVLVMRSGD